MHAMLLAAGLGTRLQPFTNAHPKALAIVNGKSLLQRNIEYLKSNGVTDIIINVHHFPEQVLSILKENNNYGVNIEVSDESGELLETGGGLMKASWFFAVEDPFVLMNVDILTDLDIRQMIDAHLASKPLATVAISNRVTSRYLLFDKNNRLSGWRNIKTNEEKISRISSEYFAKAFSGIHIISPRIFSLIELKGKFSMIDVYLALAGEQSIIGYEQPDAKFIDVGTEQSINKAGEIFL